MPRSERATSRRGLPAWLALAGVALIGIAHRGLLFAQHRAALDALAEANSGWYTGQQLPIDMLRDRLVASMLMLQQTPPVPNFLMGIVVKHFSWPTGVTSALILLEGAMSVATAVLLARLLLVLYPRRTALALAVGSLFVLATDLVVIEYNSLGQTFYEIVAMLLGVAAASALIDLKRTGRLLHSAEAGLAVALLALTRASWSFFSLPALALSMWLVRADRIRHAAVFLAPILVLQGGWAAKNWMVYGVFSPVTSTWTGWNLVNGLRGSGFADAFRDFVAARPELRCFAADLSKGMPEVDPSLQERDRRIEQRFGLANTRFNTLAMRELLAECERSVRSFARHAPAAMALKTWRAYRLFWLPPANYGRFFLGLFALENRLDRGLSPWRIVELAAAGELPDQPQLRSGKFPKRHFEPTTLYTPRWIEPWALLANLIGVHVLLPLALVAGVLRGRSTSLGFTALVVLATCYAYLAFVSSVGDYGENMRFRIGVEPLVWLITIVAGAEVTALARGLRPTAGT
jgi:hypothetical protein